MSVFRTDRHQVPFSPSLFEEWTVGWFQSVTICWLEIHIYWSSFRWCSNLAVLEIFVFIFLFFACYYYFDFWLYYRLANTLLKQIAVPRISRTNWKFVGLTTTKSRCLLRFVRAVVHFHFVRIFMEIFSVIDSVSCDLAILLTLEIFVSLFMQASIYRDENNILDLYILLLRFKRSVCRALVIAARHVVKFL